jgi:hypothetical protein
MMVVRECKRVLNGDEEPGKQLPSLTAAAQK